MEFPGLRRITPPAFIAQRNASLIGEVPADHYPSRNRAATIAKQAAISLGLRGNAIVLLNNLIAMSPALDWRVGSAPIVWPTNQTLADQLGLSISCTKYHLRNLMNAGLIAFQNSGNYHRYGRREEGEIVTACGIDLSPLVLRHRELIEIVERKKHHDREMNLLRKRRTVTIQAIREVVNAVGTLETPPDISQTIVDLEALSASPKAFELAGIVTLLEQVLTRVKTVYGDAIRYLNLDTGPCKTEFLQTTAQNNLESVQKNEQSDAHASQHNSNAATGGDSRAFKKENGQKSSVSLSLLKSACPDIAEFVPDAFLSWQSLFSQGHSIALMSGINPQVLHEAQAQMGREFGLAAICLTAQKHCAGAVANPGAYLRTLIKRHATNSLRLVPSLAALSTKNLTTAHQVLPGASG